MRYLTVLVVSSASAAGIFFSLALALAPAPIAAEYFVREMIVIKRHIAQKHMGQRKIVIASGSVALFSIDTQQLSNDLAIPVINFGLHSLLPLKTILAEAEAAAEKGDAVILSLEPNLYCVKEPTNWQVRNAIAWDRGRWEAWSIWNRIQGIALFPPSFIFELFQARMHETFSPDSIALRLAALDDQKILAKFASSPEPAVFAYSAFNLDALGNMQRTEGARYVGVPKSIEEKIDICAESWQVLRTHATNMSRKGVTIYFANTPYLASSNLNTTKLEANSRQFVGELSQLAPVLDGKHQLGFPRSLFLDSDLHLNAEGRKIRTKLLENAIRHDKKFLARFQ